MPKEISDYIFRAEIGMAHNGIELVRGWYFWDETWAYLHGPFISQEEAEQKLGEYASSL